MSFARLSQRLSGKRSTSLNVFQEKLCFLQQLLRCCMFGVPERVRIQRTARQLTQPRVNHAPSWYNPSQLMQHSSRVLSAARTAERQTTNIN